MNPTFSLVLISSNSCGKYLALRTTENSFLLQLKTGLMSSPVDRGKTLAFYGYYRCISRGSFVTKWGEVLARDSVMKSSCILLQHSCICN